MGKGDRRGKARSREPRSNPLGLPEISATPKRDKSGCFSKRQRQQPEDPSPERVVMEARARQLGIPECAANLRILAEPAGRAIWLTETNDDERNRLWKAYSDMDHAEDVFARRIMGRARHAKCSKVEFLPDNMTSENAPAADTRDEKTRDDDAVRAWTYWRGLTQCLPTEMRTVLFDGMLGRMDLVVGSSVTRAGREFVAAVRMLAKEAERGRPG